MSCRSCKTPHNHHHLHHHHNPFCPPCHQKEYPPSRLPTTINGQKDELHLSFFFCHLRNMRPWNRLPQNPWPSFANEFKFTIFPTGAGGQPVLYGYSTWQTGHCETFLSGPCYPCRSFHFCVSYPVQFPSQPTHECIHCCPQINYQGNNFLPHKFHLAPAAENLPPSNVKWSSSSSMDELQSSCRSLSPSSSAAELQSSSRHYNCSDNSSNPHSPGRDNWQSNGSRSDCWHNKPSNDSSNPHSPMLDHLQSNGSVQESKESDSGVSSSSSIYYLETDDGQTEGSQGSGSSNTSREE